jgi:hypothetical protein
VKSVYRIVLFASSLLIAGCGPGESTQSSLGLERFGLTDSPADHPLMASAIKDASKVLGDYSKIRFAEGWAQRTADNPVKVFTSTGSGFGQSEIMATYQDCGCVVAQSAALSRWLVAHLGTSEGLLSLDSKNLLTYMLLHEAGHVANVDAGRVLPGHASAPKSSPPSQGPPSRDVENDRQTERAYFDSRICPPAATN